MLQFIVSLLPLLAVIASSFVLAYKVKCSGVCMEQLLSDFGWCIESSPAQVAFFMFSITAAIAMALVASAFSQVFKQLILTLDILFFLNNMLLILLHRFKEHSFASL